MSLYQDRQIKGFLLFLTLFALLFVGTVTVLTIYQVNDAEVLWLKHDEAVSSSLLEQGVPKEVVAVAFTNTDISDDGRSLLAAAGLGKQSESSMRPYFNQFQRSTFCTMLCTVLFFLFVLAIGIFIFFWKRKRLYQQADKILLNYINGDYSCHLPQNYEGAIYQVFSSIEQLATMLQSKNETERKAKEFLKDTISDISHQLKTPLAALTMYQEIIESEPENAETVKQFVAKMKADYERQTSDISAVLTRLNAERAELANGVDNEHPALVAFMKYQNIEALNREILVELVDYIKVYENGNISVKFKFADELRKIAEYIEINTTEDTAVAG